MGISSMEYPYWYSYALRVFHLFPLHVPATLLFAAPHGKHSFQSSFNIPGKIGWLTMELVSPVALLMALEPKMGWSSKVDPIRVLTGLYMAHYLNRSIVSVLRSRQMAPMHLIVWLSAVVFNSINGSLIGTFLRVQSQSCMSTSRWFWLGVSIWALGWVSNIAHDEILMNLRRDSSGTSMASSSRHSYRTADGRLYSIPWGGLFRWVSFPSYLSELIEWTGFGLACASVGCQTDLSEIFLNLFQSEETFQVSGWDVPLLNPASLFVMNEFFLFGARAWEGHRWYKRTFGKNYPVERKALFPFLL